MRTLKFRTPVICQNGHKGMWYWHIGNFGIGEVRHDGVISNRCDCPKQALGEGYIKDGDDQQFTGLLDKQGKEIYEGDIVRWEDSFNFRVGWDKERLCFQSWGSSAEPYQWMKYCTVIGNIYESPELLTV